MQPAKFFFILSLKILVTHVIHSFMNYDHSMSDGVLTSCNLCNLLNNTCFVGVQRRMRHASPFAVYVNCRNHRLALCLTHLIKRYPLLQEVDSTLLALWKLFEFSPQRLAVFKHIQAVYGTQPLTITRAATTRWLSHLQAASRCISR